LSHTFFTPAETFGAGARRYEPGSLNLPGIFAMGASLDMLLKVGIDEVAAAISTYKKQFKLGKNKPANEGNQQSTRQQASAANNGRRKPTV
jgi:selenocysteine lyase/cysteine desulfurase